MMSSSYHLYTVIYIIYSKCLESFERWNLQKEILITVNDYNKIGNDQIMLITPAINIIRYENI